ncbi:hypothetical protein L3X38_022383 [Prunus dulcis]|uniref:Cyclic nucleotide-binding domain-containing protein n=1 Tax=Prunus dulcis TaxID=3755 RepID=A0AAD4VXH7_PRUDU|nr:hypothetical protein L3X38_022383 [Prunus dulcis]
MAADAKLASQHVSMNTLKKVPMLQYMDPKVREMVCGYLKPVTYHENSYIVQEGEQLHFMLIITEGIIWTWTPTSTTCSSSKTNADPDGISKILTLILVMIGGGEVHHASLNRRNSWVFSHILTNSSML